MKTLKKKNLLSVSLIAIAMVFAVASSEDDSPPASSTDATLNTAVSTGNFEVTFTSHETREELGSKFFKSNVADGAIYVVVDYKYKNISKKPISWISLPDLYLFSGDGIKYEEDSKASRSYRTEKDDNEKGLGSGDLNPGITTSTAKVFEVSKELFDAGGWYVVFDADDKLKLQIN